jgi:L-ascorbate metabolism protein UlaG (beta-lactamase superfamily)
MTSLALLAQAPGLQLQSTGLSVAQAMAQAHPAHQTALYWLGQAGFAVVCGEQRILIDPYLSDSLAAKYRGTRYGHERMMAAPLRPQEVGALDAVLCTHRHTDHMDPDTLLPLAQRFATLRFVAPLANRALALERMQCGEDRLQSIDAGETLAPMAGWQVHAIPAAHETVDYDAQGHCQWLGYVLTSPAGHRVYHSGDCVPYAGLAQTLAELQPHVALLPVNGRDAERSGNGVPGNFHLHEALALCQESGIPACIAHHHGMFAFNTVTPAEVDALGAQAAQAQLQFVRAQLGVRYVLGA